MEELVVEENDELIYIIIPAHWACVYHKLLTIMADFGKDIIDDCSSTCSQGGRNIITCWNLFQSAVSCYHLKMYKEADFFIEYIKKQLTHIYNGDLNDFNSTEIIRIDENGCAHANVSCNKLSTFVDIETGCLYIKYLSISRNYKINDDGQLIEIQKENNGISN